MIGPLGWATLAVMLLALAVALAAGASPVVVLVPLVVLAWGGIGVGIRRWMIRRGHGQRDAEEAARWWIVFGPLGLLLWRPLIEGNRHPDR